MALIKVVLDNFEYCRQTTGLPQDGQRLLAVLEQEARVNWKPAGLRTCLQDGMKESMDSISRDVFSAENALLP